MKEIGEVITLEGTRAVIRFQRSSACSKCGACGMGQHGETMILKVANEMNADVGDIVEVDMESEKILQASLIVYIFPLIALLIGMFMGYKMASAWDLSGNPEIYSAVAGILMTVLAFGVIRWMEPIWQKEKRFSPRMVSILYHKDQDEVQ